MGTTSATLHLALPYGADPDQSGPLLKAYARLGWTPPKRGENAIRSVVLAHDQAPFVSIHDSACEALDDGTLKQLAVALSKALNTRRLSPPSATATCSSFCYITGANRSMPSPTRRTGWTPA